MRVKSKSWFYFILFLLILPRIAFAWGEGFSIVSSSSFTELTAAITPSSSSFQPVSSYSPSESASYSPTQTFTIPASFQAIISKFDISQAVVPSEAIIQQGLQQALDFSVKSPLEGNDYKAAMIQPIMNLLLSGNYSDTTRDLCFSNLLSIASNERIDYSQKSTMVDPLIEYMENKINALTNKTINVETSENEFTEINYIFQGITKSAEITVEEQRDIYVAIASNKNLLQESPVKSSILSLKTSIAGILVADINYPFSIKDSLNKDRGKLALAHSLENALSKDSDPDFNSGIITILNSLLKDSSLASEEVKIVKDKTIFVLRNNTLNDFSLQAVCLSTLMNLSDDTRLTETERNEVKGLISVYGLTESNRKIYEDTGVLLLAGDSNYYNLPAARVLTSTLNTIPEDKRARTILLNDQLPSNDVAGNIIESDSLIGTYSTDSDIITIIIGTNWYTIENYASTLYHETTHYIENNLFTTEQKMALKSIWEEANDNNDFTRTLGIQNKSEYLATTAEAILMEYDAAQKPLLERAQQQAANNDPTLLKMYNLVEDVWGLS